MRRLSRTHARLASNSVDNDTKRELSYNDTGEDQAVKDSAKIGALALLETDDADAKVSQLCGEVMP